MKRAIFSLVAALVVIAAASRAEAIPAFARKYGTSCQTCHTIYPKLTPFGEAFRRNGFKFPGRDDDFIKADTVPMGNEAYRKMWPKESVWPSQLMAALPVGLGFNG